jgi:predicted transposase/invertase (TIGR01784 family)
MVNPKIDLVFKKLFGSEGNQDLLKSLINSMLPDNEKLKTITLLNPYNLPDYLEGKMTILDIKATDEKGKMYDIEMQISGHDYFGARAWYYWARSFSLQLEKGKDFKHLNKTIVISIVNFKMFDDELYHHNFVPKERTTNEFYNILDFMSLHFVELPKFNFENIDKKIQTTLERWITFLNNAVRLEQDKLPDELAQLEEIKKAAESLRTMSLLDKEREYYEKQLIILMDDNARLESALNHQKFDIAISIKKDGLPNDKISLYTGLPIDIIETL